MFSKRFRDIQFSNLAIKKIKKRNLKKRLYKQIKYILDWNFKSIDFKLRPPKSEWIYYFRINKQYRALCKIIDDILVIFDIDDHSN